jgi:hypothetical protein
MIAQMYADEKNQQSGWKYVYNENVHVQKVGSLEELIIFNSQNKVVGNLSNILTPIRVLMISIFNFGTKKIYKSFRI